MQALLWYPTHLNTDQKLNQLFLYLKHLVMYSSIQLFYGLLSNEGQVTQVLLSFLKERHTLQKLSYFSLELLLVMGIALL